MAPRSDLKRLAGVITRASGAGLPFRIPVWITVDTLGNSIILQDPGGGFSGDDAIKLTGDLILDGTAQRVNAFGIFRKADLPRSLQDRPLSQHLQLLMAYSLMC